MKLKELTFKKILQSFQNNGSLEKKALYKPHQDWLIIICIFSVLLVSTIVGHYLLYLSVEKGNIFHESAEQEIFRAALKRELFEETVLMYESKATNTATFNDNREVLQDPS